MNTNSSYLTSTIAGIAMFTLTAYFALGYPNKPSTGAAASEARSAPSVNEARPGQRPLPQYGTAREELAVRAIASTGRLWLR